MMVLMKFNRVVYNNLSLTLRYLALMVVKNHKKYFFCEQDSMFHFYGVLTVKFIKNLKLITKIL